MCEILLGLYKGYTSYKVFYTNRPNFNATTKAEIDLTTANYNLFASTTKPITDPFSHAIGADDENCLTGTKKVLEAYGVDLPDWDESVSDTISVASLPNVWYLSLQGKTYYPDFMGDDPIVPTGYKKSAPTQQQGSQSVNDITGNNPGSNAMPFDISQWIQPLTSRISSLPLYKYLEGLYSNNDNDIGNRIRIIIQGVLDYFNNSMKKTSIEDIDLVSLVLIAVCSMSWVSVITRSIQDTRNYIGKIIIAIILLILTPIVWALFIMYFQNPLSGINISLAESLQSFPGMLALAVGGFCGYFISTKHKYL